MKLERIIDLNKYPIHEHDGSTIKGLIKRCKEELEKFSCCTIPNFIIPKSIKTMLGEVEKKLDGVYWSEEKINPYLNSKDEVSLPKSNPKRIFSNSAGLPARMAVKITSIVGDPPAADADP